MRFVGVLDALELHDLVAVGRSGDQQRTEVDRHPLARQGLREGADQLARLLARAGVIGSLGLQHLSYQGTAAG